MKIRYRACGLAMLAGALMVACQGTTTTPMQAAGQDGWNHYGFQGYDEGQTIALGAIDGGESNVIVEGRIVDVCAKKGCWMRVNDGDAELFVRFKDYSFFVPKNAAGRRVVMHGTSRVELTSVEDLRHYALDAGKTPAEIAAITEPTRRTTFLADSVFIEGAGLEAPHTQ